MGRRGGEGGERAIAPSICRASRAAISLLPPIPRNYCRQRPSPVLLTLEYKRNISNGRPKCRCSDKISDSFETALQSSGIIHEWPRPVTWKRLISRNLPLGWIQSWAKPLGCSVRGCSPGKGHGASGSQGTGPWPQQEGCCPALSIKVSSGQ